MCYKHSFKERPDMTQPTAVNLREGESGSQTGAGSIKREPEVASEFCPGCSARLAQRSCKLICPACGYYMSCSDFYWEAAKLPKSRVRLLRIVTLKKGF